MHAEMLHRLVYLRRGWASVPDPQVVESIRNTVTGTHADFSDRKRIHKPAYVKAKLMTTMDSPLTSVPVTCIEGDGIGPEMMEIVQHVLKQAGAPLVWEKFGFSSRSISADGTTDQADLIPKELLKSMRRTKVGLRGALYTPLWGGHKSLGFQISNHLGLYAHVVHCRNLPGIETRHKNIDMVVIREYTEGLHLGLEHEVVDGVIESLNISTTKASERIIRYAFEFALRTDRKKVTCIHKANILKMTDGAFLNTFKTIASEYPSLQNEGFLFLFLSFSLCFLFYLLRRLFLSLFRMNQR